MRHWVIRFLVGLELEGEEQGAHTLVRLGLLSQATVLTTSNSGALLQGVPTES